MEERKINTLGLSGFILGLIATVIAWVPFMGWAVWSMGILGIIFSSVGIKNSRLRGRMGLSISGLVLSVMSLILKIISLSFLAFALIDY